MKARIHLNAGIAFESIQKPQKRLILSLSGGFGLLLSLNAGLLVVLSLSDFGENAGFRTLSFKSSQSTIQGFIFLDADFCHLVFPPSALTTVLHLNRYIGYYT